MVTLLELILAVSVVAFRAKRTVLPLGVKSTHDCLVLAWVGRRHLTPRHLVTLTHTMGTRVLRLTPVRTLPWPSLWVLSRALGVELGSGLEGRGQRFLQIFLGCDQVSLVHTMVFAGRAR